MFGITFTNHPDLTRILMPEDWEGHPLRKDYDIGTIPVQFSTDFAATTMSIVDTIQAGNEPEQGLKPRSELTARELLREVGSVLRMSEAEAAKLGDVPVDPSEDQTMIINMGPQHPSTHGVLRLMLELRGEEVLRCKPIIGYLHTGMEKTGENLTYMQGGTNVTRMDYVSPLNNELVFSMATEKLLGIDGDIPERAVVDAHAAQRAEPHEQPPAVPRHQRHGHRCRVDDDLRLARARGGAALLPEGHRPADEPQLHPSRRCRRRPAGRMARRRAATARPHPAAPRGVRHVDDRPADLARAAAGRRRDHRPRGHRARRDRPDPAQHRNRVGPAPRHAIPALPRARRST